MKWFASIVCCVALALLAGCSSTPLKFPSVSAQDLDLKSGREISGKSCGFQLLYLIPININGRFEDAYSDLMGQAGREVVANVRTEESWFYAFVGTGYCTKLMATAYQKKQP